MNNELFEAQQSLNEYVIRVFWKQITESFPSLCINDGISIDYKNITLKDLEKMVSSLSKCSDSYHVATPLFEYNFEPLNKMPHHISAIVITKTSQVYYLSFFNPKGKTSFRKEEEEKIITRIAYEIEKKTHRKVVVTIYNGDNLQMYDKIGLCQLYSLFYLYEYMLLITGPENISDKRPENISDKRPENISDKRPLVNPHAMVQYIIQKRGSFDEKILYVFWKTVLQLLVLNKKFKF